MYSIMRTVAVLLATSALVGTSRASSIGVSDEILQRLASRGITRDNLEARTTQSQNNYCSPGYYWFNLFGNYGFCLQCGAGSWCPGGDNAPENSCPAGTANPRDGSSSSTACKDCNAGYYAGSPGSDSCDRCPFGQSSGSGASSCYSSSSHRPRAAVLKRAASKCKNGFMSCPTFFGRGGMECVDIMNDLESCGGCTGIDGEGSGVDCTAIEGAAAVQCVAGQCVVDSCARGYRVDQTGTSCDRASGLLTQAKRTRRKSRATSRF